MTADAEKPTAEQIPRCDQLDGSTLRIVPSYTEAGRLCEANCVTITDGFRTCVYVPLAVARSLRERTTSAANLYRDDVAAVLRNLAQGRPVEDRAYLNELAGRIEFELTS